ncbi:SDR family oxidoreductase [Haloarculaceae archaeon H-GB1-1]|nr:SDR family oxidoreductase [Haloarculaceae archaeon H-GB1-1]
MKTVLVTGCSSGIGRATALEFRRREWTVYATARDPYDLTDLADAGCETDTLDVTSQSDVDRVVDRIVESEGRIDCLVNNAGYGQFGPIEDVPISRVHAQFDVNVYGPHRLTRAVLPHMRERGEGTIVNVSSTAGRLASPMMGVYAGSKHALEAMSDALRAEVDSFGVDVVLVEPGPVKTPFGDRAMEMLDDLPRSDGYEDLYHIQRDTNVMGGGGGTFGVRPDAVAETIVDAANVADPAARYPVGDIAKLGVLGRYLPDRIRDRLFDLVRWVMS